MRSKVEAFLKQVNLPMIEVRASRDMNWIVATEFGIGSKAIENAPSSVAPINYINFKQAPHELTLSATLDIGEQPEVAQALAAYPSKKSLANMVYAHLTGLSEEIMVTFTVDKDFSLTEIYLEDAMLLDAVEASALCQRTRRLALMFRRTMDYLLSHNA